MARITIECNICGSKVITTSAAEVIEWNAAHPARCPGPPPAADPDCAGCGNDTDSCVCDEPDDDSQWNDPDAVAQRVAGSLRRTWGLPQDPAVAR